MASVFPGCSAGFTRVPTFVVYSTDIAILTEQTQVMPYTIGGLACIWLGDISRLLILVSPLCHIRVFSYAWFHSFVNMDNGSAWMSMRAAMLTKGKLRLHLASNSLLQLSRLMLTNSCLWQAKHSLGLMAS